MTPLVCYCIVAEIGLLWAVFELVRSPEQYPSSMQRATVLAIGLVWPVFLVGVVARVGLARLRRRRARQLMDLLLSDAGQLARLRATLQPPDQMGDM